jgi:hypothetical protein
MPIPEYLAAFLSSPEQMLDWGFQETPYIFNLEQDRASRKT